MAKEWGHSNALHATRAAVEEGVVPGGESSVVLNNVKEGKGNYGYNAANGEYVDIVIPPFETVKSQRFQSWSAFPCEGQQYILPILSDSLNSDFDASE